MEYTQENMGLVAEAMIRKMEVQDLVGDAYFSLMEIYKISPEHFYLDSTNYENEGSKYYGPFMELVKIKLGEKESA